VPPLETAQILYRRGRDADVIVIGDVIVDDGQMPRREAS